MTQEQRGCRVDSLVRSLTSLLTKQTKGYDAIQIGNRDNESDQRQRVGNQV
jgi:hypothetical protein